MEALEPAPPYRGRGAQWLCRSSRGTVPAIPAVVLRECEVSCGLLRRLSAKVFARLVLRLSADYADYADCGDCADLGGETASLSDLGRVLNCSQRPVVLIICGWIQECEASQYFSCANFAQRQKRPCFTSAGSFTHKSLWTYRLSPPPSSITARISWA